MNNIQFEIAAKKIKLLLFDCDGVLSDGKIVLGTGQSEMKFFSAKDGMGIDLWRKAGFMCGCISGRTSEALSIRSKELYFDELHQNISNKRLVLKEILSRRSIDAAETAYIGDDVNDLRLFGEVGIFMAPADAHSQVTRRADRVLTFHGGNGAIREAIDMILDAKKLSDGLVEDYLSKQNLM
ncbi:MAG: HAD hydrolase family protein [Candidatus Riflebacteria bacterium]|nr:HAD hydrolase family protein [Candidatus Riflebacteria bacterium]